MTDGYRCAVAAPHQSSAGVAGTALQAGVEAARSHQLRVGALLHDGPALHDDHAIGMLNGREPMGNHQRGSSLHQPLQGVLNQALGFGVER